MKKLNKRTKINKMSKMSKIKKLNKIKRLKRIRKQNNYPPTHRWSCVVDAYCLNSICIHEDRLNSYDPTSLELI